MQPDPLTDDRGHTAGARGKRARTGRGPESLDACCEGDTAGREPRLGGTPPQGLSPREGHYAVRQ